MTPAQLAALTAISGLLERAGNWKIGSLLALLAFLPDIIFVAIIVFQSARQDKALTEMKRMHNDFASKYDTNVELVKQVMRLAENLQSIVVLNTQTLQGVQDRIDNNLFCPMVRKSPRVETRYEP